MIKANELRVGNWIIHHWSYDDIGPNPHDSYEKVPSHASPLSYEKEYYKPIPLTSELLIQCQFEILYWNPRLEYFYVNKQSYYPFFVYETRDSLIYYNENLRIEYLHQLQNLFFELTREELNIEL